MDKKNINKNTSTNTNTNTNTNPVQTNTNNGDKGLVKIKTIRNNIGIFLIILGFLLLLYYIYSLTNRFLFNFKDIGDRMYQGILYKLHLSRDYFGLKRDDYIDFDINIRTSDGSSDCRINGRKNGENLEFVDVKGESDICQNLSY